MSNVPKSKRKKTDFETTKQLTRLRADITQIVILDFGYDPEKYQKMIDKAKDRFLHLKNADDVIRRMQTKRILDKEIDYETVEQSYKSWMGAYAKLMSKKQRNGMKQLYKELFGKEPRWK